MNYLDYFIIISLIIFALIGFKKGFLGSIVSLIGLIAIIIISFYLKNPLAAVLYQTLPFFSLKGLTVLNILVYEAIAFLVVFSILMLLYRFVVSLTKILDKTISFFIFFGIPSKILGMIIGLIEGFVFVFIVFFIMFQFNFKTLDIKKSKYGPKVLTEVPVLSNIASKGYNSMKEIYDLNDNYKDNNAYNEAVFDLMLKNNILSPESARKLVDMEKLKISNAEEIIIKYESK